MLSFLILQLIILSWEKDLVDILKQKPEGAVDWFRENKLIINPDNFQSIVIKKIKTTNKNINLTRQHDNITT